MKRRNILLNLAFDGKNYNGWQKQKNALSIQATIEMVLAEILEEKVILIGCGRTDGKAHAISYTANFHTTNFSIPVEKIKVILNSKLPEDIRILNSREVGDSFHSRFSAKAREYVYIIFNTKEILPHFRSYVYQYSNEIDICKLKEAMNFFVGTHNFKNFSIGYSEGEKKNFERTIYYFRVKELYYSNQKNIIFYIKGNGFLKGMIRLIVSVCLNYSEGKIKREEIIGALENKKPLDNKHKVLVPAEGLYFKRAYY